jgi:hypothetical protein
MRWYRADLCARLGQDIDAYPWHHMGVMVNVTLPLRVLLPFDYQSLS